MIRDTFVKCVQQFFPFPLTAAQQEVVGGMSKFLFSPNGSSAYILRGYAGTGKTVLISAVVKALRNLGREVVLLAPTGRAAKVFSLHADYPAYTIHKQIYRQREVGEIDARFDLDINKHKNAVFIIDEASMVANDLNGSSMFASGLLLDDLVDYVCSGQGCRMILVGDNAQLPPVGEDESPALQLLVMKSKGLEVAGYQLTTVMRQAKESGILSNATELRRTLSGGDTSQAPKIRFSCFEDIISLSGAELVETLESDYDSYGQEQVVIVTRSNKRAVEYNLGIRSAIFGRDENLTCGDVIMIVRNNYYWTEQLYADLKDESDDSPVPLNFLANGDIAIVRSIRCVHEFYGLHFADVSLQFPDYDYFEMDVRVVLDALTSEAPGLTREQSDSLYMGVSEDYADISNRRERVRKFRMDPNFNAVQIKYAYAVTCHKAQGGQWRNVYVDQGWLPPASIDRSYYRWLYTAMTRATERLYLVNWPEEQSC